MTRALDILDERTVGRYDERGLLIGAACAGDGPAGHRRAQRRRLHGIQVRRAGHLWCHTGHTRLNEQPPYPLPRMVRPSRSILEYRRYVYTQQFTI